MPQFHTAVHTTVIQPCPLDIVYTLLIFIVCCFLLLIQCTSTYNHFIVRGNDAICAPCESSQSEILYHFCHLPKWLQNVLTKMFLFIAIQLALFFPAVRSPSIYALHCGRTVSINSTQNLFSFSQHYFLSHFQCEHSTYTLL